MSFNEQCLDLQSKLKKYYYSPESRIKLQVAHNKTAIINSIYNELEYPITHSLGYPPHHIYQITLLSDADPDTWLAVAEELDFHAHVQRSHGGTPLLTLQLTDQIKAYNTPTEPSRIYDFPRLYRENQRRFTAWQTHLPKLTTKIITDTIAFLEDYPFRAFSCPLKLTTSPSYNYMIQDFFPEKIFPLHSTYYSPYHIKVLTHTLNNQVSYADFSLSYDKVLHDSPLFVTITRNPKKILPDATYDFQPIYEKYDQPTPELKEIYQEVFSNLRFTSLNEQLERLQHDQSLICHENQDNPSITMSDFLKHFPKCFHPHLFHYIEERFPGIKVRDYFIQEDIIYNRKSFIFNYDITNRETATIQQLRKDHATVTRTRNWILSKLPDLIINKTIDQLNHYLESSSLKLSKTLRLDGHIAFDLISHPIHKTKSKAKITIRPDMFSPAELTIVASKICTQTDDFINLIPSESSNSFAIQINLNAKITPEPQP